MQTVFHCWVCKSETSVKCCTTAHAGVFMDWQGFLLSSLSLLFLAAVLANNFWYSIETKITLSCSNRGSNHAFFFPLFAPWNINNATK